MSTAEISHAASIAEARLDAVISRVRDLAHLRSTGPMMRQHLGEVANELSALRRDLSVLDERPLSVVPEPAGWDARRAKPGDGRTRRTRSIAPNDHAGQRFCPMHHDGTGAWLPIEQFDLKDDKGHRKARCHGCILEYQRQRYVRVGYKVVTIEIVEGDACVGHKCPECGKPFSIGERVQGDNVRHERCPS
jgi:hypothetical protein